MASPTLERRRQQRQQIQQQPQQSEDYRGRDKHIVPAGPGESSRQRWQARIEEQARKQSGKL